MEIKHKGINFKNTYRYNSTITEDIFKLIIEKATEGITPNSILKYKGTNLYLYEALKYWYFMDSFGDDTLFSVNKKDIEDINYLKIIGD